MIFFLLLSLREKNEFELNMFGLFGELWESSSVLIPVGLANSHKVFLDTSN